MKIIMWLLSALPLAASLMLSGYLPDTVPMHFGIDGRADGWGSKYDLVLLSLAFLIIPLIFQIIIAILEKRARTADENERVKIQANIRVMSIVVICTVSILDIIYGIILYSIFNAASGDSGSLIIKAACILMGVLFIITGNFMPKTKRNSIIGLRTKWSMYNDDTWMKSNRFCGFAMMIMGAAVIILSVFVPVEATVACLLWVVIAGTIVLTVYSYIVYKAELKKGGR